VIVTGERITTPRGGFNPTWQRHVAAYALAEPFLGPGRVLDVGCGIGHSYERLAPRETVGLDVDAAVLAGQSRPTVAADMRELPFAAREFAGVIAVHSIEHVPDPSSAIAEAARVLDPAGTAVFVTPNRLTFARPDEVIDPYHWVEYDAGELGDACAPHFSSIELQGLFGSERYLEIFAAERRKLEAMLRRDPLRLRRLIPRRGRQLLYDWMLSRARRRPDARAEAITEADFDLRPAPLEQCLDLVAVCRRPLPAQPGG
jgi:SAM-dependent methyltransferase